MALSLAPASKGVASLLGNPQKDQHPTWTFVVLPHNHLNAKSSILLRRKLRLEEEKHPAHACRAHRELWPRSQLVGWASPVGHPDGSFLRPYRCSLSPGASREWSFSPCLSRLPPQSLGHPPGKASCFTPAALTCGPTEAPQSPAPALLFPTVIISPCTHRGHVFVCLSVTPRRATHTWSLLFTAEPQCSAQW